MGRYTDSLSRPHRTGYAVRALNATFGGIDQARERWGAGRLLAAGMLVVIVLTARLGPRVQAAIEGPEPIIITQAPVSTSPVTPGVVLAESATLRADQRVWPSPTVPYKDIFVREAARIDVPWTLLAAIAKYESEFNSKALSSAGARGLMQFMPATWTMMTEGEGWTAADVWDADKNVWAAASYISYLRQMFWDTSLTERQIVEKIVCAYCFGPGNVKRYGVAGAPSSVKRYTADILAFAGY